MLYLFRGMLMLLLSEMVIQILFKKLVLNVQYNDDFEYIGEVKVEDRIKVKGHPHTYYNEARDAIVIPEVTRTIIKREDYDESEYNTKFYDDVVKLMLTTSFLSTAYLAGSGKTWLLVSLFVNDGDSLFLVPTHGALVNIQTLHMRKEKKSRIYS